MVPASVAFVGICLGVRLTRRGIATRSRVGTAGPNRYAPPKRNLAASDLLDPSTEPEAQPRGRSRLRFRCGNSCPRVCAVGNTHEDRRAPRMPTCEATPEPAWPFGCTELNSAADPDAGILVTC